MQSRKINFIDSYGFLANHHTFHMNFWQVITFLARNKSIDPVPLTPRSVPSDLSKDKKALWLLARELFTKITYYYLTAHSVSSILGLAGCSASDIDEIVVEVADDGSYDMPLYLLT